MNSIRQILQNFSTSNLSVTALREMGLQYWRERVYTYTIATMAVLGLIALVPSLFLSFSAGFYVLGVVDLLAYLYVLVLLFFRRLSYRFRASQLILLGLVIGLVVFYFTGDEGAGMFWLFMVPPLASLLFGLRWGSILLGLNLVIIVITGYLVVIESHLLPGLLEFTLVTWIVFSVNFLVTNALVTIPLGVLLQGLFQGAEREKKIVEDYQLLFDNNPLPMWVYDAETLRFLAVNEAAIDHYGYSRQEFLGMGIKDIRPAEEISRLHENVARTKEQLRQTSGPWKHTKKDGTLIDVEIFSHHIEFGNRPARLVLSNDITEREKAERAVRESENLYRELAENSQTLVCTHDLEGNLLSVNSPSTQLTGYSQEKLLRMNLGDLIVPERKHLFPIYLNRIKKRGKARGVMEIQTASGERRIWEYNNTLAMDGRAQPIVRGMALDITERKNAEARLRLSDQILQRVQSLVLVIDPTDSIIYASPSAAATIGYSVEEIMGDGWWNLTRANPEEAQQEREGLRRIIAGEVQLSQEPYEREIRTRSGEQRWIEWQDAYGPKHTIIGVGRDITERKHAEERIQTHLGQLQALSEIDRAILSSFDLTTNLKTVVDHVVTHLGADAANIMLFDPVFHTLKSQYGQGFQTGAFEGGQIQLGEGWAGRVAAEKRLTHIAHLGEQSKNPQIAKALSGEKFVSYYGVPLIAKGQLKGVLEVFHRSAFDGDADWLKMLEAFAGQAAIAIDTVKAFEELQRTNAELVFSYDAAIEGWSRALDLRDEETEGHTQRVTELSVQLASTMGLRDKDLVHFRRGALLHDIGKMAIPDSILLKPSSLTEQEWAIMRLHPAHAREMLESISYLQKALDIPYRHHEKWDGSGYPGALKGEEIPLAARIFAVVDVFDALTSDRPYRKAWTKAKTLDYIREQSGRQFDPKVVEAFLKLDLP